MSADVFQPFEAYARRRLDDDELALVDDALGTVRCFSAAEELHHLGRGTCAAASRTRPERARVMARRFARGRGEMERGAQGMAMQRERALTHLDARVPETRPTLVCPDSAAAHSENRVGDVQASRFGLSAQ